MTEVRFTHANYKTEVIVYAEQVFAIMHLPTSAATTLLGPGSVGVPVTGTVDEANIKIKAAINAARNKES